MFDPIGGRPFFVRPDDDAAAAKFLKATEQCRNQAEFDVLWHDLPEGAREIVDDIQLQLAIERFLARKRMGRTDA